MTLRWRGRQVTRELQVANACDDSVNLTPVSEAPAVQTRTNWSALLSGQDIPLIGERRYDGEEEDC